LIFRQAGIWFHFEPDIRGKFIIVGIVEQTMFDQREKIVLLIDGANLYATSRSLGFDIDYKLSLIHI